MGKSVYQIVTDRIVEQMNKGIVPWQRPWHGTQDGAISYTTGKPYSLLNQLLLGKGGEWLTFNQIVQLGGKLKKGAKAGIVTFCKSYTKEVKGETEEDETTILNKYCLRYYNVYHLDDVEGIDSKLTTEAEKVQHEPIKEAEKVIGEYISRDRLKFQNDKPSNCAFYRPTLDEVVVPMMEQFEEIAEYYSTTFHELTHSTGHRNRLNRKGFEPGAMVAFGSETYSQEELVAEIGSAMCLNKVGIECDKAFKNSIGYLQGWLKALKNDPKMIVFASAQAEKATKYIFNEKED
jgi:antirestriction protein ArdC